MALRILVADDHEVVRRGLCALLEAHAGWQVCGEAADGREAVAKAKDLNPDILVMDIGMPALNGLAAADQIMQANPRQRILILTITRSEQVIREVLEETGVQTRFDGLVCFRHWHGYRYGKSDIYFVCRLSPLSRDVTMQAEELEECFWMPVEDYFASDLVSLFNKRIVRAAIDSPGVTTEWIEGYADPSRYEFFFPRSATAELP